MSWNRIRAEKDAHREQVMWGFEVGGDGDPTATVT